MKTQNKKFRFINNIFYVVLFTSGILATAQSITVNSTNYKQTIDMIGGDMERSASAIQNAKNKTEIIQWGFGDINFNVCRVQYDKNQELVEGVKNWSFYNKQVATMQAIKAINPDIKFFATMRSDYDGYGDDNNMPDWIHTYNTKVTDVQKYGVFLADYCEYMSQQGVPITFLSTAKEWMWHVRASKAKDIINTLYSELDKRGIQRPVISDQGFWSISQGITYLGHVEDLGTKDMYHSFCSHNYDNEAPEKWVEIIQKSAALGKPMYDDETSTGSGSPTYGEERAMFKQIDEYIKKAQRYAAGLSGEIFFEIWSRGIDKETRAIYYPASGTGTRLRGYYMMKQFSNNILNHTYVTASVNDASKVYTMTFRKDNKIVLWVINEGTVEYTLPIKMDQSTITSSVASHYWTNDTPIEGSTTSYTASGNTFIPTVKGESMNCYIFDVTEDAVDVCSLPKTNLYEAECYDAMLGVGTEASSEGTDNVSNINNGDWIKFDAIDFSTGLNKFSARVASNTSGGKIELRTGSSTGALIGELDVNNTGGWQNWTTKVSVFNVVSGVHDLYLVFTGSTGSLFNLNWIKLEAIPPSVTLVATPGYELVTLEWSLNYVELGTQNIYRNTSPNPATRTLIAGNVTGTKYEDKTVTNNVNYWYWVEAIDASSVVINSEAIAATPSADNLALNGLASQSTTAYDAPAERAIDGNTDGDFNNGSVSHTAPLDNDKWWQVDLGEDKKIEYITIYNRTQQSYSERLNNFTVNIIDSENNTVFSQFFVDYPDPSVNINTGSGGVIGQIVKISKSSDEPITLAEVEVYGIDIPNPGSLDFALNAVAISETEINLSWKKGVFQEDGFKVERKVGNGTYQEIASLSANSLTFSDTGLTPETTYTYRVMAFYTGRASNYSVETPVTTFNSDFETVIYNATEDVYVRGGDSAGLNFGTATNLVVKKGTVDNFFRKTLLKFNLTNKNLVKEEIGRVILKLYIKSGDKFTLTASKIGNDWSESTVTWNTAPATGGTITSTDISSNAGFYEWDVTAYAKEQLANNESISISLEDLGATNKTVEFNSKEAASNVPELILTMVDLNPLSVSEFTTLNDIGLYPIPVKNIFTITNSQGSNLEIYSIVGKLMLKNNIESNHQSIDISHFVEGLYVVKINNNGYTTAKKLIKK
ncbi:carbohydrate-binding protein [Mariniflexile sp.]|uniref:CBM96 family carbohydrate-binding protein n=1 Tax=Mariniflexile sp. TaxID=1979402 RepID=UPI0035651680